MRRMLSAGAAIAVLLAPLEALALSCAAPNLAEDFNRLDETPGQFLVAYGTLSSDVALPGMPDRSGENQTFKGGVSAPFTLTGRFLSTDGFGEERRVEVRVNVECQSAWCGAWPPQNGQALMFVEALKPVGLRLVLGPCGGPYLANPTEAQIEAMQACFAAGSCGPEQIAAFAIR